MNYAFFVSDPKERLVGYYTHDTTNPGEALSAWVKHFDVQFLPAGSVVTIRENGMRENLATVTI